MGSLWLRGLVSNITGSHRVRILFKIKIKVMAFIYFLLGTGFVALIGFMGVMWYDRKHQYDW